MTRHDTKDVIIAFRRLTDAAEDYVNRSPRVKRIQDQRTALLEAIGDAQLVLSVHALPKEPAGERAQPSSKARADAVDKHLKRTQAQLHELEHRLRPLSTELEALEQGVQNAKTLLDRALAKQDAEQETHKARHAA
jgi:chromosome segregation ATPase